MAEQTKTEDSKREIDTPEHSVSSTPSPTYGGQIPAWKWLRKKAATPHDMFIRATFRRTVVLSIVGLAATALVGFGAGWLGANYHSKTDIMGDTLAPQKQVVTS